MENIKHHITHWEVVIDNHTLSRHSPNRSSVATPVSAQLNNGEIWSYAAYNPSNHKSGTGRSRSLGVHCEFVMHYYLSSLTSL